MRHLTSTNNMKELHTIVSRDTVPRRPALVRVLFSTGESLDIDIESWVDLRLKVGMTVPDTTMDELRELSIEVSAMELALKYLSHRVRTERELLLHLRQKEVSQGTCERVVQKLRARGYLDDRKFASLYQQGRQSRLSRKEMTWKLKQKGVSTENLQSILNTAEAESAERDAAMRQGEKYWRLHRNEDIATRKRKLMLFLMRKGFPQVVVSDILHELENRHESELS